MELLLERTDLVQVGTVSYRNTMKLISGGKSGRQRLVVGDDHGYVEFIHDHAEELRAEFAESPTSLQYMAGIITDFFVDRMKFCGIDARHKLGQLERLLDAQNYDVEKLVQFFDPNLHRSG